MLLFEQRLFCNYLPYVPGYKTQLTAFKYGLLTLSIVLLTCIAGCTKSKQLPYTGSYQAKQIKNHHIGATYVICKNCVEYTKINKFQLCEL